MKIEIVAIGNEVLSGTVINSNAAFISHLLIDAGYVVARHTVLPDHRESLKMGLEESLRRSRLIIATGGLGPTCDDLTRDVVAELFGSDFYFDTHVEEDLKKRYGDNIPTLINQATVPTKAILLKNDRGTAPGMIFHGDGSTIVLLPGVPAEMRPMMVAQVLPYLQKNFSPPIKFHQRKLHLCELPESVVDPFLRLIQDEHPAIDVGIYPGQGVLTVTLAMTEKNEQLATQLLDEAYGRIYEKFHENIFYSSNGKLEMAVHEQFLNKKLTLSAAESCTGGSFSARITSIPGASDYFLGSVVAYSNSLKENLLDVPSELVAKHGAVSAEVVRAMCLGIQAKTGSDYAVAISGIAGPTGGTPDKPVGTLWCAIAKKDGHVEARHWQAYGSREMVIERGVNLLLSTLYKYLK